MNELSSLARNSMARDLGRQVGHGVLAQQERAAHRYRERLVERFLRVVGDRRGRAADPGVGDHDVQPPELVTAASTADFTCAESVTSVAAGDDRGLAVKSPHGTMLAIRRLGVQ